MSRVLALLVLAALASPARSDDLFKGLLDCAKATRVCSTSGLSVISTPVRDFGVLVAPRAGKAGFYVIAAEESLFFDFPPPPAVVVAPPPAKPSFFNLYGLLDRLTAKEKPKVYPHVYYKVELGISDPVFVSFLRQPDGSLELESVQPMAFVGRQTEPGKGQPCATEPETQALIRGAVLQQIGKVFATWSGAPAPNSGDVSEEYALVGRASRVTYKRDDCLKSLEPCALAAELREAANAEREKFSK